MIAALLLALALAPQDAPALVSELGAGSVEELVASFPLEPDDATDRALKELAELLFETGDLAASEAVYREQLRGRAARFGEMDPRTEPVISNLSWVMMRRGRYREAVESYEALLERAIANHGETSLHAAATRINLASAYQTVGRYGEVEQNYLDALETVRELEGPQSIRASVALSNLALFLNEAGRRRSAEQRAREAHEIRSAAFGPDSPEASGSLQLLGIIHEAQGRLDQAEAEFRASLEIVRSRLEADDERVGTAWLYVAGVLFAKGDHAGAEACWKQALPIYLEVYGERHNETIRIVYGLGLAAWSAGRVEEAGELLARSVAWSAEAMEPTHPAHVVRVLNLAALRTDQGELEEAEEICRSLLDPDGGEGAVGRLTQAEVRAHLGAVLLAAGRLEGATSELAAAAAVREELLGADHPELVGLRAALALALETRGELERAAEVARAALAIAERSRPLVLGDELDRARLARRLSHDDLTDQLARLAILAGEHEAALEYTEQGRARLLLDLLHRSESELSADEPEARAEREALVEAEEQARFRSRAAERRLELATGEDQRAQGLTEVERARGDLREASARVFASLRGAWPESMPLDADGLRAGLEQGELLLSFAWSERMAAVLLAPAEGQGPVRAHVLALGELETGKLGERVAALGDRLARDPARRGPIRPEELAALSAALLPGEVREGLAGAERLVVVADGPLRSVPLELLLDGPEIVHAPSGTVYLERRLRGAGGRAPAFLVALADPSFPERPPSEGPERRATTLYGNELRALPASRAEALRAARLFEDRGGEAVLLLGDEATRAGLEQVSGKAGVLHLATHGVHGTDARPFDAALALAWGKDGASPDSFLTLDRLIRTWRGRLEGCDLVMLSACDSHREVLAGSSTVSLPWGFFYAGAPTVVATLWKVDDRAAALLTGRFYENLLGARPDAPAMSKVAALREAKRWLRDASRAEIRSAWSTMGSQDLAGGTRSGDGATGLEELHHVELRPYADPYYWASFVLLGAPE